MSSFKYCALVCLLGSAVASATGQEVSSPPQLPSIRDARALSILQRSFAAMGGRVPSDSTASGTVEIVEGSLRTKGTIRILTRGFDQTAEFIDTPEGVRSAVYSRLRADLVPAEGLDCKHNANCEFGALFYSLMKRAGTPCSRPATFSRPQRRLAIPSSQQIAMSVFIRAMLYRFLGTVDVRLGPPLVQVVWSRIILDKELNQK